MNLEGTKTAAQAPQRIVKVRRDYNTWVADETMEDYALRFTARSFRKWSEFRVANTAFGAVSFLALEAIGGTIALNDGFVNAFWAAVAVALLIFGTGLPISYYAAKYGLDMDLLTRGAGFGYIGSTITSLIYASFTFLFFAIEATIMALALQLSFGIPLTPCYLLSALIIVPLVTHGITLISRLQAWTQPVWLALLALPYACVLWKDPQLPAQLIHSSGIHGDGDHFSLLLFGCAAGVAMALIAQIGEQVDFLRFMPERTARNRRRWIYATVIAGPGWIAVGILKLLGGALLAYLVLNNGGTVAQATQPTQMYLAAYQRVFSSHALATAAMLLLVIVSQVKINVTNAYAGSLAWSNFFARITHSHPGRVVWLVFNVLIAVMLMELGIFKALEDVLGFYSNVAISWVGALVADLVINKPLGLSPTGIEFKRACLYDINPVGVGAMLIASVLSILAFCGVLGPLGHAFSWLIALASAFVAAPVLAYLTHGRYYIARPIAPTPDKATRTCCICEKTYEPEDMAMCPAYQGEICSLCCSLDARCHDLCKPGASLTDQLAASLRKLLPGSLPARLNTRLGHYLMLVILMAAALAVILALIYTQQSVTVAHKSPAVLAGLRTVFLHLYAAFLLVGGIGCWWLVLAAESRRVAQEESNRQTHLLMREIEAHRRTDAELQRAKQIAERANLAKSRYITGISHELRTPLNSILGYAQIVEHDLEIPLRRRGAMTVIRRSGEHLVSLIDGLLDIAKIETGKLTLEMEELCFPEFIAQLTDMFQVQARNKRITFRFEHPRKLPRVVHADKKRLGQILINIIGNAIKFTEHGTVTVNLRYRRETAIFEVRDSGIGISEHDFRRIFLPFERGSNATSSHDGGAGLGLTIAQMLTNLMGGELTGESSIPGGSLFRLKLFLPEVRRPKPAMIVPSFDIHGYRGPRRKLLIVDNERVDRELLVSVLEPLGFTIAQAASGIEALRSIAVTQPDLILLDISMPGIDGWEVSRLLRANHLSNAPILVISANAFDGIHENIADITEKDCLLKPVDMAALLARLREKLDLNWIQTQSSDKGTAPPFDTSIAEPRGSRDG